LSTLLLGWCEELLAEARRMGLPALPELPFDRLFGDEAPAAREAFAGFRKALSDE
jgi:hypothetical protein